MRKTTIPALFALGLSLLLMGGPVYAASVDDVVAACDRMDAAKPGSCSYTVDDGGLHGCTANVCFTCPVDGSRQCHAVRKSSGTKGTEAVLGTVKLKCGAVVNGWCQEALDARMGRKGGK